MSQASHLELSSLSRRTINFTCKKEKKKREKKRKSRQFEREIADNRRKQDRNVLGQFDHRCVNPQHEQLIKSSRKQNFSSLHLHKRTKVRGFSPGSSSRQSKEEIGYGSLFSSSSLCREADWGKGVILPPSSQQWSLVRCSAGSFDQPRFSLKVNTSALTQ